MSLDMEQHHARWEMNHGMSSPRVVAFFLPQFHPIPENDEWWGAGFTDWRQVAVARPLFRGHHQPDLPADLGFYDLRVPEVMAAQWKLAEYAGIDGFCFYHYWSEGRQLLETPVNKLRSNPGLSTRFMLCWANENWTRNWDGGPRELLREQTYSEEDDRRHFESLLPFFRDQRYIRHEGRPVFVVYRPQLHPDIQRMSGLWQELADQSELPGVHLCGVEDPYGARPDPAHLGLAAAVEFMPDPQQLPDRLRAGLLSRLLGRLRIRRNVFATHALYDYRAVAQKALLRVLPPHPVYRSVTPSWDNTPRRPFGGRVLVGATPNVYQAWLTSVVRQADRDDVPFVFVNAWNEWAEGAHLEPDLRRGRLLLDATAAAVHRDSHD